MPGTLVGEYQLDAQIGAGGMGRVYAATHPVIAKRAAIKILHPELSVNSEAVERFVQEARSVNQIGHPNIVDIFSFGTLPDGRCYFVMEWLRGESLRDRLRKSQLPLFDALLVVDTITAALEAAHEKGIVHRDLKPDNIYLVEIKGAPPQVKLLDFGIAKLLGNDDARAERTRTGNLLGTPAYMSPEQARGHLVDHRTDIYALGCVAHEMFTGALPFPADNSADMIAKHLFDEPPSARVRNPHLPPELDVLVQRMLSKEVADRPTLAQVRAIVRGVLGNLSSPHAARLATPAHGVPYAGGPGVLGAPGAPGAPGSMLTPSGQLTPPHAVAPMPTPITQSTLSDELAPRSRSKTPAILLAALAVLAAVIAFAVTAGRGDDDGPPRVDPATSAGAQPSASESSAAAGVTATPIEPVVTPTETPVTETPVTETPVIETPPTETAPTPPGEPAQAKTPEADANTEAASPAKASSTADKPRPKRPGKKRPVRTKREPVYDPDAPM